MVNKNSQGLFLWVFGGAEKVNKRQSFALNIKQNKVFWYPAATFVVDR